MRYGDGVERTEVHLTTGGIITAAPGTTLTTIELAEYHRQARERFGATATEWRFRCPHCSTTFSVAEFMNAGGQTPAAGQECIGNHVEGRGCNWKAYGLIEAPGTLLIELPNGKVTRSFPLATPHQSFVCPRCGAISHQATDANEGYCNECHDFTGDEAEQLAMLPALNRAELNELAAALHRRYMEVVGDPARLAIVRSLQTAVAEALLGAREHRHQWTDWTQSDGMWRRVCLATNCNRRQGRSKPPTEPLDELDRLVGIREL